MARYKLQGRARDTWGNATASLDIYIYVAGTNRIQDAIVYTAPTGSTAISASPQISSDTYGFFSFWVDDTDYTASTTKFDIYADGLEYTYVDIFNIKHHGTMGGLAPDDHVRYPSTSASELITGNWRFSQPLSGATPTANAHFTTKGYTDIQYLSALGDTVVTGDWTFINPVTGAAPSANNHLTTKQYVDTQVLSVSAGGGLIESTPNTFAVNPDNLTIAVLNDQVILKPIISGTSHSFSENLSASGNLNVVGDFIATTGEFTEHVTVGNDGGVHAGIALRIGENFDSDGATYGQFISAENLGVNAGAGVTAMYASCQNSNSTLYDSIKGGVFVANGSSNNVVATYMYGVDGLVVTSSDNSTITNIVGGFFEVNTAFSMVGSSISKMVGGEFTILGSGSGDVSITDAFGVLINSPGFVPSGTTDNIYGLYIDDQSNAGFTSDYNIYSAGANSTNLFEGSLTTQGAMDVGVDDTTNGVLTLYGDNGEDNGGAIKLYLPFGETGIGYNQIRTWGEALQIGTDTDPDAIEADFRSLSMNFHLTSVNIDGQTTGDTITLHLGQGETRRGILKIGGLSAPSPLGAQVQLFVPDQYDALIDYYGLDVNEDDLRIGPSTDQDALKYDGGLNLWQFTTGETRFGTEDSPAGGQITIYSDSSTNGGKLQLHTGPAYDTTITHYQIYPFEDDLYIGPSTDTDALKYDGTNNVWQFTRDETRFGTEDAAGSSGGLLTVYGNDSNAGGEIHLHLGAPYDTTITHYQIQGRNDDLEIGPSTNPDALQYDGGTNQWIMSGTGGVLIGDQSTGDGSYLGIGINNNVGADFGTLNLYAGTTADGGTSKFYLGNAYDTTIDYYQIRAFNANFQIGPVTDPDALLYDGTNNVWQFTRPETRFGTEDSTTEGQITIYGDNSNAGGEIHVHLGAAYDTTITHYQIRGWDDDLYIGPSTDTDALKYDGGLGKWIIDGSVGGVELLNAGSTVLDTTTKGFDVWATSGFDPEISMNNSSGTVLSRIRTDSTGWSVDLGAVLEKGLEANVNAGCRLAYNDSWKFETTNTGATVTGTLVVNAVSLGNIEWNSTPNNLESSGNITTMTVSGSVFAGYSLYMTSAGNVELSDADSATTMPVRVLALENGTGNKNVLLNGFIRDDSWNWTPGKTLYASTSAGIMTQVAPSGSGDQVQVLGYATHADRVYFNPEYTLVQVV